MALTDAWLKANSGKRDKGPRKGRPRWPRCARHPQGKVVFQMRYRYNRVNAKRLDLGTYPAMSLKRHARSTSDFGENRNRAMTRRSSALEKKDVASAAPVEPLFRLWYEKNCKLAKTGHHEVLRTFELYVFPNIGEAPRTSHAASVAGTPRKTRQTQTSHRREDFGQRQTDVEVRRQAQAVGRKRSADIYAKSDFQLQKREDLRSLSDDEIVRVWRAVSTRIA